MCALFDAHYAGCAGRAVDARVREVSETAEGAGVAVGTGAFWVQPGGGSGLLKWDNGMGPAEEPSCGFE